MASRDFIPQRLSEFLGWSNNFAVKLAAIHAAVGISGAQSTAYTAADADFGTKYTVAIAPGTRTKVTISDMRDSLRSTTSLARDLARIIQAYPGVTNGQRDDLGLTPRTGTITPISPPDTKPALIVRSVDGRQIRVELKEAGSESRGKPAGVDAAWLFSFVGNAPPISTGDWKFEGETTRTLATITADASIAPGSKIFLAACWINPRGQAGPGCDPVVAYIAGGTLPGSVAA